MESQIAILGSGNVATHLASAIDCVTTIYSRDIGNAQQLAKQVGNGCHFTDNISDLVGADSLIVAVKDDAIRPLLEQVPQVMRHRLWMHTSGSVGIDVFPDDYERCGVLYPLQTFSKTASVDMRRVPLFVEGNTTKTKEEILMLAHQISDIVNTADSQLRGQLHIAAVFACNFSNYMYTLSEEVLSSVGLDLKVMQPLLEETLRKAIEQGTAMSQTGPASRGDREIIARHEAQLKGEALEVYKLLSENILKRYNK